MSSAKFRKLVRKTLGKNTKESYPGKITTVKIDKQVDSMEDVRKKLSSKEKK